MFKFWLLSVILFTTSLVYSYYEFDEFYWLAVGIMNKKHVIFTGGLFLLMSCLFLVYLL